MTLFEALTGGAFDRLNWQHSGEFDQNFSKKSNARGFCPGGGAMSGFRIDRYIITQLFVIHSELLSLGAYEIHFIGNFRDAYENLEAIN